MKVIFLDHDGVIRLGSEWGSRFKKQERVYTLKSRPHTLDMPVDMRFDNFNKKALKVLNEILEETGAEIVMSSDWKHWANVNEIGEYYEDQGIIKKPIAFTKQLGDCDVEFENELDDNQWRKMGLGLEQDRTIEIKQYIKDNPEITHWVAIDDLDMGNENWGLDNFVLTPRQNEGIKQSGIKDKVIKFLKDDA